MTKAVADVFGRIRQYVQPTPLSFAMVAAAFLCGCASQVTGADKATFSGDLDAGNYKAAEADAMQAGAITPDGKTTNIVWALNAAPRNWRPGMTELPSQHSILRSNSPRPMTSTT